MAKSYWQSMSLTTPGAQDAIRLWMNGLADGMTCEQADVLCDIDTDREKRLRAIMVNGDGVKYKFTRTVGKRYSIKSERMES